MNMRTHFPSLDPSSEAALGSSETSSRTEKHAPRSTSRIQANSQLDHLKTLDGRNRSGAASKAAGTADSRRTREKDWADMLDPIFRRSPDELAAGKSGDVGSPQSSLIDAPMQPLKGVRRLMVDIDKLPPRKASPRMQELHSIMSIGNRPGIATREARLASLAKRVEVEIAVHEVRGRILNQIGKLPKNDVSLRRAIELIESINKLPDDTALPWLQKMHAAMSTKLSAREVRGRILDQIEKLPKNHASLRPAIELMEDIDKMPDAKALPLLKEWHAAISNKNPPSATTRKSNPQTSARRTVDGAPASGPQNVRTARLERGVAGSQTPVLPTRAKPAPIVRPSRSHTVTQAQIQPHRTLEDHLEDARQEGRYHGIEPDLTAAREKYENQFLALRKPTETRSSRTSAPSAQEKPQIKSLEEFYTEAQRAEDDGYGGDFEGAYQQYQSQFRQTSPAMTAAQNLLAISRLSKTSVSSDQITHQPAKTRAELDAEAEEEAAYYSSLQRPNYRR